MRIKLVEAFKSKPSRLSFLIIALVLNSSICTAKNPYLKYLDSADFYLESNPVKSVSFLEKIPRPIAISLKGHLPDYYETLAFAYYHQDNYGLQVRYLTKAIHLAKKEKKYKQAGRLCIELFTIKSQIEDSPDESLLRDAEENYNRVNDKTGLLNVLQARIYTYYLIPDYQKCIELALENREKYKLADDRFIDLVNDYLICSSYLRIDDIENARFFYGAVSNFQLSSDVSLDDLIFHKTSLDFDFANYFYTQENLDSATFYLNKVAVNKMILDYTLEWEYYQLGAKISTLANRPEAASAYQDSLIELDRRIRKESLKVNVDANEQLVSTDEKLTELKSYGNFLTLGVFELILVMVDLLILMFFYRHQIKKGLHTVHSKTEEIYSAHKKEQKLSAKVIELEKYLMEIKTEVREISDEEKYDLQRAKLLELYRNINLKSNIIQDENSLPLANEVNSDFFVKLRSAHTDLSDSEISICYYLFLGFKNKEIAVFRNTTIRSIESKRFRLSKKINFPDEYQNLTNYLNHLVKD